MRSFSSGMRAWNVAWAIGAMVSLAGCEGGTEPPGMCGSAGEVCCAAGACDLGLACTGGFCQQSSADDGGVTAGPLSAWTGAWYEPSGQWQWQCTDSFGGSRGGTHSESGGVQMWSIVALDSTRIGVTSTAGSRQWSYIVAGNVATLEEGSFSGGADVDEPGNEITTIAETLTLRADGTLYNEVFYEYRTAGGETCTEEQSIVLSRTAP